MASRKPDPKLMINELAMARYEDPHSKRISHVLAVVGKEPATDAGDKGFIYVGMRQPDDDPQDRWKLRRLQTKPESDSKTDPPAKPEDLFPHEEETLCVAFNQPGTRLATGTARDNCKLWDVNELVELLQKEKDNATIDANCIARFDHSSNVIMLAFDPNSKLLATVSSEGEAALWPPVASSEPLRDPQYRLRHDAKILDLNFSPDGQWIITGGQDKTARVWNRANGDLVGIFPHAFPVDRVWMPTDKRLLTLSAVAKGARGNERQLRYWDMTATLDASAEQLQYHSARRVADTEWLLTELLLLEAKDYPKQSSAR